MSLSGASSSIALIVIPVYNGLDHTLTCLESLSKGFYPLDHVLVVDNGSSDGSAAAVRKAYPVVEVVVQDNLGFGAAANVGIRAAISRGHRYTWLLNNDTLVPPGSVESLIGFMDQSLNSAVGACSPVVRVAAEPDRIEFCGGWVAPSNWTTGHFTDLASIDAFNSEATKTRFLTGCAMLIRNRAAEEIGMFDERFFMYWEDVDFCLRLVRAGYGLQVVPSVAVLHAHMGSSGEQHPLHPYYSSRNRFLMRRNHQGEFRTSATFPRLLWSLFRFFAHVSAFGGPDLPPAVTKGVIDGIMGRWGRRGLGMNGARRLVVSSGGCMVGMCVRLACRFRRS